MRGAIPSVIGLLAMTGCSDAVAVGNTVEKVCKQQVSGGEILQQLLQPIPGALPPELLHCATRE
jgi:hypothetical protein